MADVTQFKGPVKNEKADKFEAYLKANQMNFFLRDPVPNDENGTVIFKSNIEAEGQRLPVGIITDNTVYTIIRVQVGTGLIKDSNREKFNEFLNELNRSYKVFKYVASDDGTLFLDSCIPSTAEFFDPQIVRVILDVIVNHLQEEYKTIMKKAWD